MNSIGYRLKLARTINNMTLEEVAKIVGVSRQTIQRYESGVISNIPSDKIELLAKALKTTPAALMGWYNTLESKVEMAYDPRLSTHNSESENSNIPIFDDPDIRMIARKSLNSDPKKIKKLRRVIEAILADDEDDD